MIPLKMMCQSESANCMFNILVQFVERSHLLRHTHPHQWDTLDCRLLQLPLLPLHMLRSHGAGVVNAAARQCPDAGIVPTYCVSHDRRSDYIPSQRHPLAACQRLRHGVCLRAAATAACCRITRCQARLQEHTHTQLDLNLCILTTCPPRGVHTTKAG
jgi:hypothetical protein